MAAKRPSAKTDGEQLNLFSSNQNHYDSNNTDTIRQNGGETLARIPPEHGGGNGSQRSSSGDALGGRGENGERDARPDHEVPAARLDGTAGERPGLGNGAGGIHPVAAGSEGGGGAHNQKNSRFSPADGVGAGSPKEKC